MGNFNHLPTDIVLDILIRLSTESVLECKLVCKPWRNLVSYHPSFSQLHLNRLLDLDSPAGKLSFVFFANTWKQLCCLEYSDEKKHCDNDQTQTPIHSVKTININPPFSYFDYFIIGSVNGLVCLFGWPDHAYCICNLVTREYVILPTMNTEFDDLSRGFGYDSCTNKYKVVKLYKLGRDIKVAVYTLGSGNGWRIVESLGSKISSFVAYRGVFANGALHWLENKGVEVLAFDLTKEKFREHLSPPPSPLLDRNYRTLGEFGGVLYYAITHKDQMTARTWWYIWLLNKKKVEDESLGWSKYFCLPDSKPLAFTKSGGVLCAGATSLDIYDEIASTSKMLVNLDSGFEVFPHQITLVSLKELGEGNVKIFEPANWLSFLSL